MRLWLSICAALVFAAGCTVGLLLSSHRCCEHGAPRAGEAGLASPANDGTAGESVVASMVDPYPDYPLYLVSGEDFYDELGLDREQRRRLEDLFARHFESVGEVRRGMARVAAELREGVLQVLTDEQEIRFGEVQKRYSANKIRHYVGREMVKLRDELELRAEQEPAVYRHLYDAFSARQKAYLQKNCKDLSALGEQLKRIEDKLDRRLQRELFANQYEMYVAYREKRKLCSKSREKPESGNTEDCAPDVEVGE